MRPAPWRSQASKPWAAGARGSTWGSALSRCQLRCTAAASHMSVFIAAATSRGARQASRVEASRLSARPWTRRAKLLAESGTSNTSSAHAASSICRGRG